MKHPNLDANAEPVVNFRSLLQALRKESAERRQDLASDRARLLALERIALGVERHPLSPAFMQEVVDAFRCRLGLPGSRLGHGDLDEQEAFIQRLRDMP
jgi:hypothetical protein